MKPLGTADTIKGRRDDVWAFFTNFEESAKHLHWAVKVEFHSAHRTGLGAEWTEHDEDEGEIIVSHRKIIEFDQPHRYVMTSDNNDSFETMEFRFTDQGEETLVAFDLAIKPKGLLRSMFVRAGKGLIFDMMNKDLDRIKAAFEAGR